MQRTGQNKNEMFTYTQTFLLIILQLLVTTTAAIRIFHYHIGVYIEVDRSHANPTF